MLKNLVLVGAMSLSITTQTAIASVGDLALGMVVETEKCVGMMLRDSRFLREELKLRYAALGFDELEIEMLTAKSSGKQFELIGELNMTYGVVNAFKRIVPNRKFTVDELREIHTLGTWAGRILRYVPEKNQAAYAEFMAREMLEQPKFSAGPFAAAASGAFLSVYHGVPIAAATQISLLNNSLMHSSLKPSREFGKKIETFRGLFVDNTRLSSIPQVKDYIESMRREIMESDLNQFHSLNLQIGLAPLAEHYLSGGITKKQLKEILSPLHEPFKKLEDFYEFKISDNIAVAIVRDREWIRQNLMFDYVRTAELRLFSSD